MKSKSARAALGLIFLMSSRLLYAAVGCDLNDPDRDVKRLFPGSTGFKTLYVGINKKGGEPLLRQIEERLGDKFKGLFESLDVPYTMYQIFKGRDIIGFIHGVNQKGQYGGIQVFLALDLEGTIKAFYFQKLTSRAAKMFRDDKFCGQFIGLSLEDFYRYDAVSGREVPPGKISRIASPDPASETDFRAALRATKKNLILVDEFLLDNKHLRYHKPPQGGPR